MHRLFLLVSCLVLSVPHVAAAETFHRIEVALDRVSTDLADARVDLIVQWGANLPPTERISTWREAHGFDLPERRRSASVPLEILTFRGPDTVRSVVLYGTVIDNGTGEVVRVIPVSVFDLRVSHNDMVDAAITVERDFSAAFRASYPFRFLSDSGFVNDDNARETLLAISRFLEFSAQSGYRLTDPEWNRIRTFFLANSRYFTGGNPPQIIEILNYLGTFSSISDDRRFQKFYAEFLNAILDQVDNRPVGPDDLHSRVLDDLLGLYLARLPMVFEQADLTLQTLDRREYHLYCVDVARTILSRMDRAFLEASESPRNIRSVMTQASRCGQFLYEREAGGSTGDVAAAAAHLSGFDLGRSMMRNFVRVVDDMDALRMLRVTDQNDRLLGTYHLEYSKAVQGTS